MSRSDPPFKFMTRGQVRRAMREELKRELPAAMQDLRGMLEEFNENAYLLKEWLTPEEASRYVGGYWKPTTVRRYVQAGKLPGTVQGNLTMVHRPGLEEHWKNKMRGESSVNDGQENDQAGSPGPSGESPS